MEIKREYWNNGNIRIEEYYENGELHRADGPAVIQYYKGGAIYSESYFINGKNHREDGPAEIYYDKYSRSIVHENYYVNGKAHRVEGPAIVYYDDKGKIDAAKYFINGIQYDDMFIWSVTATSILNNFV